MIADIIANFKTTLAKSVEPGDVVAEVTSIVTLDGTDIPNGTYGFTIGVNDEIEHFTAVNDNGTLTEIKSVNFVDGAETVGFKKEHDIGDEVRITNHVALKRLIRLLQGIDGISATNPLRYLEAPTLSNSNEIATVGYVLSVVTGGTVTTDSIVIAGTADEGIIAGETIYLKENGRWERTNASTGEKALGIVGMAIEDANSGAGVKLVLRGMKTGSYTPGTKFYLSDTPGQISDTPGTVSVFFGESDASGDLIITHIPGFQTVTAEQKAALAGTKGDVGDSNRYVTDDDTYSDGVDQSDLIADGTIAVGEQDITGRNARVMQVFTAARSDISGVSLFAAGGTGDFEGQITAEIFNLDSSLEPTGVAITSKTVDNFSGEFRINFDESFNLIPNNKYGLVVEPTTTDTSNHPNMFIDTTEQYSGGQLKTWNSTDGWEDAINGVLTFKTFYSKDNRVVRINDEGVIDRKLSGLYTQQSIGVNYSTDNSRSFIRGYTSSEDGKRFAILVESGSDNGNVYVYKMNKFGVFKLETSFGFGNMEGGAVIQFFQSRFIVVGYDSGGADNGYAFVKDLEGSANLQTPFLGARGNTNIKIMGSGFKVANRASNPADSFSREYKFNGLSWSGSDVPIEPFDNTWSSQRMFGRYWKFDNAGFNIYNPDNTLYGRVNTSFAQIAHDGFPGHRCDFCVYISEDTILTGTVYDIDYEAGTNTNTFSGVTLTPDELIIE